MFSKPQGETRGSTVTLFIIEFPVQKSEMFSVYHQTRPMILTKRWIRRMLQDSLHTAQILYDMNGSFGKQEVPVTEVLVEDQENVERLSNKLKKFLRIGLPLV